MRVSFPNCNKLTLITNLPISIGQTSPTKPASPSKTIRNKISANGSSYLSPLLGLNYYAGLSLTKTKTWMIPHMF